MRIIDIWQYRGKNFFVEKLGTSNYKAGIHDPGVNIHVKFHEKIHVELHVKFGCLCSILQERVQHNFQLQISRKP